MNRPFSHSSLSTYRQCPARYKFSYVDNIEKPQDSIEAFLGKRVHETLEFLYKEVLEGTVPLFDQVENHFREVWNQKWHSEIVFVADTLSAADYFSIGWRCLSWYYRKYRPFRQPVVGVEVELLFDLASNGEYPIKGIVDRLEHHGDGVWEIHDYKTSKRPMTQVKADGDTQLALYQIGLEQTHTDVADVRLIWHFLRTGVSVRSSRTPDQLERLKSATKRRIDEIKQAVAKGGPFPAKQSMLCNWCYYWQECPSKIGDNPFVKTPSLD